MKHKALEKEFAYDFHVGLLSSSIEQLFPEGTKNILHTFCVISSFGFFLLYQ